MTPPARRRLLLVHAHPDDETLTTGGTMARYAAAPDTSVTLVTCTLGEQGEIIPPELAMLGPDAADQLGGYRIGELAGACAALGVTDHRFLGGTGRWRDSGMVLAGHGVRAATPERLHPRALAAREALADQVDALTTVLEEVVPQVVVTYAPDGGYGHPDHVRAHDVTAAAVRRVPEVARLCATVVGRATLDAGLATLRDVAGLPFRMPAADELPSVPDTDVTVTLDVSAHRAARLAALAAHATQVALWPRPGRVTAYAMSNRVAQPLLDVEEFVVLQGEPAAPGADDLFAGVGVMTELPDAGVSDPPPSPAPAPEPDRSPHRPGLLALLVLDGLLLGAIGLVLTPMYAGSVPTPVGAVLSIMVLPWLVLRTGELDPRPWVAGAPLLAWLLAVGVLGLGGPGGDVLLPATWQSALLVFGGLLAGLLALRHVLIGGPGTR